MIALVRIDNRLLHGQILEAWIPRLKARRVVVADDEAAASPLAQAALMLCVPPDLPAEVVSVAKAGYRALAAAPAAALVLFRDVAALRRAVEHGLTPEIAPRVNLGNVHYAAGRRPVTPSVFLTREELDGLAALEAAGFQIEARAIPADAPVGLHQMRENYEAAGERR